MKLTNIKSEKDLEQYLTKVREGKEHLTSRQACKLKCYDCCQYNLNEVKKCPANCCINVYTKKVSSCGEKIKRYCSEVCDPELQYHSPKKCTNIKCPLYTWMHRNDQHTQY